MTPTNLGAYHQPSPYQQDGKNVITLTPGELYLLFKETIKEKREKEGKSYPDLSLITELPLSTLQQMMMGRINEPKKNLLKIQKFISKTRGETILIIKKQKKQKIKETESEKHPLSLELYDRIKLAIKKLLDAWSTFDTGSTFSLDRSRDPLIVKISKSLKLPKYFLSDLYYRSRIINGTVIGSSSGTNLYVTSKREAILKQFADDPLDSVTIPSQEEEQNVNINTGDNIVAPPLKKQKTLEQTDLCLDLFSLNNQGYPLSNDPFNNSENVFTLSPKEKDSDTLLSEALEPTKSDQSNRETDDEKPSQEKKENAGSINNFPPTDLSTDNNPLTAAPHSPSALELLDAVDYNFCLLYEEQ
jgi:hypothetical protein